MHLPLTADTRQAPANTAPAHPSSADSQAGTNGTLAAPAALTDAHEVETPLRTHRRFDRAARLFTEPGLHTLMRKHVMVIGVGGKFVWGGSIGPQWRWSSLARRF